MFERFTDSARQVVVLAQDEARLLKHPSVGTEHLLLGMVGEREGVAARVLADLGIELAPLRAQLVRIVGVGDTASDRPLPFTPRTKRVLELAKREAQALGHTYIATEHLLLGLVCENEGVGARILHDHGADPATIQDAVAHMLARPSRRRATVVTRAARLVVACPDCGEPFETVAADGADARVKDAGEGDHVCSGCGATWRVAYTVTWQRKPPQGR
jgi:ATP-dependent Clp protease ATP-binding subunit ClpC